MTDLKELLSAVLKAGGYSDLRSNGLPEWSILETIMVLFRQPREVRERHFWLKHAISCGALPDEVRLSARHFDTALSLLGHKQADVSYRFDKTIGNGRGVTVKAGYV